MPIDIFPHGSGSLHTDEQVEAFATQLSKSPIRDSVQTIAFSGNTVLSPVTGDSVYGTLSVIKNTTPLRQARSMLGQVASGRVGVYALKGATDDIATSDAASKKIVEQNIAHEIDDYGEAYGGFSALAAPNTPWVPRLHNGTPDSRNCVKLVRSELNRHSFGVAAVTNMTPAVDEAIDALLAREPAATVGDYLSSPERAHIFAAADLENKRVAHKFAVDMGVDHLLTVETSPTLRTTNDEFGAPVKYARPDALARWGELMPDQDSTVRVSNGVYDLRACEGSGVPVLRSPLHGLMMVSSPRSKATIGFPLNPAAAPKTLGSLAVHAYRDPTTVSSGLGAEEKKRIEKSVHWRGEKNGAQAELIDAFIGQHDVYHSTLSPEHYKQLGHADVQIDKWIALAAIVV